MKKNKKPIQTTKKNVKSEGKGKLHKFMMWFLAIALIASMFLPALLGFLM